MLGRIILAVLGVLLLALAAALLLPVRIRFSYDQGALNLWVRYGPLRLQLFPRAEKAEEPAPQTAEEPPEKKKKRQKKRDRKSPERASTWTRSSTAWRPCRPFWAGPCGVRDSGCGWGRCKSTC